MGDLAPGDEVFGHAGRPATVTWVSPVMFDRTVYKVSFDDRDSVLADADHQWLTWSVDDANAGRAARVVTTSKMAERVWRAGGDGRQSKWRIPLVGQVEYDYRKVSVPPYVLGAWLGDGDTSGPTLTFHESDRHVFDRCRALVGSCEPHRDTRNLLVMRASLGPGGLGRRPGVNGDPSCLRQKLRDLGVLGCKRIPVEYLTASVPQRRELLEGLLDTDGYVTRKAGNSSQVEFTSKLEGLATDVLELVRSLGYKARIKFGPMKLRGRVVGTRYRVFFTARDPVFSLPRKLAAQNIGWVKSRARYRCITNIEEVESVPVQCIAVDGDGTYLMTRSYTVTHKDLVHDLVLRAGRSTQRLHVP